MIFPKQGIGPKKRRLMFKNQAHAGAIAGIISTLTFIIIHDIFISDIWAMTGIMLFAGALCGLCVGWSYSLLVEDHKLGRWLSYNALYVFMLMLLGVASVVLFEPEMSFAALMALNGPPDQLIAQAMPMTLAFTLAAAIVISLLYKRSWKHFGAILITSIVLVLLLGLNVSAIGLISIPKGSSYLVAEFLGLIVLINIVFVAVFIALEWRGAALTSLNTP
jgi:hypothetical protein